MNTINNLKNKVLHPQATTGTTTGIQQPLGTTTTTGLTTGTTGFAPSTQTNLNAQMPLSSTGVTSSIGQNVITQVEHLHKPAVVRETIIPQQKVEVQPVIHRDIQQTEIHSVVQPMRERDIAPTQVIHSELPREIRPEVRAASAPIRAVTIESSRNVLPTQTQTFEKAPIVEQVVHKKVIEEVQPILYKEVVQPTVIEQVRPIYETVVEAPTVISEERSVRDLGVHMLNQTTTVLPTQTFNQTGFSSGFTPSTQTNLNAQMPLPSGTTGFQQPLGTTGFQQPLGTQGYSQSGIQQPLGTTGFQQPLGTTTTGFQQPLGTTGMQQPLGTTTTGLNPLKTFEQKIDSSLGTNLSGTNVSGTNKPYTSF